MNWGLRMLIMRLRNKFELRLRKARANELASAFYSTL